MGVYLNPGNDLFRESLKSEIYVDKTGFLAYLNRVIGTEQKNICVSRPRRFGKSMAAEYVGFTEEEAIGLCGRYRMDFSEVKRWYDGYLYEGDVLLVGIHYNKSDKAHESMIERYKRN